MPLYFQRPENALKRANEFIDVGEKQWALDALYDVIKSRKHRTWQKIHEPIMCKYLQLCVDLKKSHVAKEGLFQYRNICQQVNIKSLEDVVRGYLALAEEKTEAAREESQLAVVDIDDLDQVQTPENLLLSAVSSEDFQDRTDRVVLTPWVKFLWESYRQCLELLRNNSRVERLYHDIAQQAFKFCLKYNRKTEFRKLCDNLRTHLGHIHKHQNQQTAVNLNNPESQAMHLETRLVQLDSAITIELWQEAYKAIEDIHGLMNLSKKAPNPRLMANYYQKLSLVFWKSNNLLFHAAALFRLFYLSREQKKNITQEEIQKMAARVVLATLAIPMPPKRPEIDRLVETDENVIDKNHRLLSTLLGLPNPPSRASLSKDLVRFGIIQCAPAPLQDLYRYLEVEFHALKLCPRVQQAFDFLNNWEEFPELRQYIPPVREITVVRLVKEVSQVYQTISFTRLLELCPFVQSFRLEYVVTEIARRNDLQARIDHKKGCFHFGSELTVSQREEVIEGPHLQSMPSERMRNHLVFIYSVLNKAVNSIQPDKMKLERKELCKDIVKAYMLTSSKDHIRILNRQQIIEERKEMLENLNYQKEVEERKILEVQQQKLREAEKERMARETEERTKQRLLREQSELKRKVVMEKIEQLKKTEIGSRIFEGMDEEELEKLDPDDILSKQVEQLDRERKELQAKLRKQERKIDHLERAKRIEETSFLQAEYEEDKVKDQEFWEEHERERIRAIKEERALSLQYRNRLVRLKDDRDKFLERLKESRITVYHEKLAEFKTTLEKERKKRLDERRQKRKEERRAAWRKEQEEKRQRLIDEEMKKKHDEELARLEEIEAKKRAKEREIEERLKREREELAAKELEKKKLEDTSSAGLRSWREREQDKQKSWAPDKLDKLKAADEPSDWRNRPDEPRKFDDRPSGDVWRRKEKPREEREDRPEGQSWRSDKSQSSFQRAKEPGVDEPRREVADLRLGEKGDDRPSDWRRGDAKDDKPWRRDESQRDDRSLIRDDGDRGQFWRRSDDRDRKDEDLGPNRDDKRRVGDRDGFDSKSRFGRDFASDKYRPGENRDRFSKLKSDEGPDQYDRYGPDRGLRSDRDRVGLRSDRDRVGFGGDRDRDRGGFGGDTERDRGGFGGDRERDRGGFRGDRERDRGGFGGDRERDRGGYGGDRDKPSAGGRPRDVGDRDRPSLARSDNWRGARKEAPDLGSWRKDDKDSDKRGPRDDRSSNVDEDGFTKVRY